MFETKILPKGYRISITSWENDADNYQTKIVEGLNLKELLFLSDFLNLFKIDGIRNCYESHNFDSSKFVKLIREILVKYPDWKKYQFFEYEHQVEDDEQVEEFFMDFQSYYMGGGEFYTRHLDSIEVDYFKEDVIYDSFKLENMDISKLPKD